jgi:hypothetical protein
MHPMPFMNSLFWAFFASYIVHVLDESLLNGGFVRWISENFWPSYHVRMFFWFNAAFIVALATSNVLFDSFGGHWVILPLILLAGFAAHTLTVHWYWTFRLNTYSPGLLTSSLYLVIFYLLIRYGLGGNLITEKDFVIGTIIGIATVGLFLTVGPTLLFPRLMR